MATRSMHRRTPWLAALWCGAMLAGCGGGGDSPAEPTPGNPNQPPTASATCGFSDFAATALARVNQWRASGANCGDHGQFGPAPAIAWSDRLTQAATAHSQDMQANNFFSHTGSNQSTLAQRVDATGYGWSSIAENIAAGQTSIQGVVDGWMASPGHCANIMNPSFQHMGLACVPGTSGNTYPTYWTMDLGRPG
ncbi:CAP domain-containing protein [Ideonella sp. BN130291]|uniref:CAP domain-containing protein n=1 Tax=Ideonella sp. BN130291 TaxID=3112940 RepID=UPI002E25B408|nr:CAP domain-containing protein [Ideonella sp. BN130291]